MKSSSTFHSQFLFFLFEYLGQTNIQNKLRSSFSNMNNYPQNNFLNSSIALRLDMYLLLATIICNNTPQKNKKVVNIFNLDEEFNYFVKG